MRFKNEIPSITNLLTNGSINTKINQVKNEIPSITNLATTTDLTGGENKIPDHRIYIITPEFNNLTAENFAARSKQANTDFKDKLNYLNKKVTSNKSKHLLVEN